MQKYRVGIIGCGRVASLLEKDRLRQHPCTHAGAYVKSGQCEIVTGCDINRERLNEFGYTFGVSKEHLYEDYRELLDKEELDIVSICTWTHLHKEMTIKASKKGLKAILCEKPIATNLSDAREMIKECEKNKVILAVNHHRRYDGYYQGVKKFIEDGGIGEVRTVAAWMLTGRPKPGWHSKLEIAGGGPLMHDGTHMFDILRYFFGEFKWIQAFISREKDDIQIEDRAVCYFEFENGIKGFMENGGVRNYFHFEVDILGQDGRIHIGNGIYRYYKSDTSRMYEGFRDLVLQDKFIEPLHYENTDVKQVLEIINAIENKGKVISTGYDATKALELIFACYYSSLIGNKIVYLPLKNLKFNPLKKLFET
ncbi:MAG: Gfo/Idh/MocA family oxidoreductase [Candidatus Hydrogenedentota bacterium]